MQNAFEILPMAEWGEMENTGPPIMAPKCLILEIFHIAVPSCVSIYTATAYRKGDHRTISLFHNNSLNLDHLPYLWLLARLFSTTQMTSSEIFFHASIKTMDWAT